MSRLKINSRFLSLAALASMALLSFCFNFFGFAKDQFYDGFQRDSELLVVDSIVAEKNGLNKNNRGLVALNQSGYDAISLDTAKKFFITDVNWAGGISKFFPSFFVPNNGQFQNVIQIGRLIQFPDGSTKKIIGSTVNGPYLNVLLDGEGPLNARVKVTPIEFGYQFEDNSPFVKFKTLNTVAVAGTYDSQFGIQGRFFSKLANYFNIESVNKLRLLNATFTTLMIIILCVLYARNLNFLYSFLFALVVISSPWIISFAPNLYWVPSLWFLPAIICLLILENIHSKSKVKIFLVFVYFFSILIKCLAGYEYISSIILFSTSIFLIAPLLQSHGSAAPEYKKYFFITTGVSVVGFVFALLMHANMRADNIFDGLRMIYDLDVKRRTYGNPSNFDPAYAVSLSISPFLVVKSYVIDWATEVFFYVPGFYFKVLLAISLVCSIAAPFFNLSSKKYLTVLLISLLAPISWFLLAKGHSHIHKHMNYVLWYLGTIPMMLYCIAMISKEFTPILFKRKEV